MAVRSARTIAPARASARRSVGPGTRILPSPTSSSAATSNCAARGGPLDVARLDETIALVTKHIAAAKERDQRRWNNVGIYVWPNNYVGATWADEVAYLRYWLRKRLTWLDRNLDGQCPGAPVPPAIDLLPVPPLKPVMRKTDFGFEATIYQPDDQPAPPGLDPTKFGCP